VLEAVQLTGTVQIHIKNREFPDLFQGLVDTRKAAEYCAPSLPR
jgi:hypothetical protein